MNIKQLLDEVEHDIMNYQCHGWSYLPKPKAEADKTERRLKIHNIMQKLNSKIVLLWYIFLTIYKRTHFSVSLQKVTNSSTLTRGWETRQTLNSTW